MTNTPQNTQNGQGSNDAAAKNRFRNKKKKNRFISNAKGFGKKGIYGRGTQLEEDQFTYFINILDTMKSGFESLDDKVTMSNNVFEQTKTQEIHLSSNQIVCKAIENLIGFVDDEHLERFQVAFSEKFRPICSDKFASHVLQKMIEISFLRAIGGNIEETEPVSKKNKSSIVPSEKEYNTTHDFSREHREACSKFVLKIGKFLLNNLEDFVWDPYASHIMRTAIISLAGVHTSKVAFQSNTDKLEYDPPVKVPDEWLNVVREYANRLQMWPQFFELSYNELSSALIGHICIALKVIDKNLLKHFGKKVLNESFLRVEEEDEKKKIEILDNDGDEQEGKLKEQEIHLPKVFYSGSAIRLLETLLTTSGRKLFTQLHAMLFTSRLSILALDRSTNFSVQKLIENVKEKTEFEAIFDELSGNFEDLLKIGHTGVIYVLALSCLRHQTKQGGYVTALQNALHSTGSKEKSNAFFNCVLKLKPYEIACEDKSQFVHLHGSLILQTMLKFNKPIKLVQCLLEIPSNNLATLFSTPNGSFIADAFMESKFVGEKSREKLIRYMEGNYLDMAITKFGSRVVEKLFESSGDNQKVKIVKELADKVNQLVGTLFGRVLHSKLRVETYRLSANQWKAAFDRANKAEKLFKDIIQK